jgi:hypothetical protein
MSLFGKKNHSQPSDSELEPAPRVHSKTKFGIDDAVLLMRTLPLDQQPELVVQVVKNTLASMNVSLKDTLRDGVAKHDAISTKIAGLKASIAELEEQIRLKSEQVLADEAELRELDHVVERLEAAGEHEPTNVPLGVVVRPTAHAPPPPPRSTPSTASAKPGLKEAVNEAGGVGKPVEKAL